MMLLFVLSLFVVSGDVFFTFQVGGFTVRIFQVLVLPVILGALWDSFWSARAKPGPLGFKALLAWACFIIAFVPNTSFLARNVGYAAWLVFDVLIVFGITRVIDTPQKVKTILKWYLYSFAFSAAFGFVQIGFPLLGLPAPLVQQWWFPGILARINGFTFEPSYYATYMITGWVLVDYLRLAKLHIIPRLNLIFWMMTAAIFLSSSRLGWAMMLTWLVIRTLIRIRSEGIAVPRARAVLMATVLMALVFSVSAVSARYQISSDDLDFLANGLGLFGHTDSHSAEGRLDVAKETLRVFYAHPIIGVSLGGVAGALGGMRHSDVYDQEGAKDNEGMCTTAEVLAASGILGFVPYLLYMKRLMWTSTRCNDQTEWGTYVRALGWSLIMLILTLQFNQTILRTYLWLHIGLLSAAYCVFSSLRRASVPAARPSGSPALIPSPAPF